MYCQTYPTADYDRLWEAVFIMCELFRKVANDVAVHFGFRYPQEYDVNMTHYLKWVHGMKEKHND